jgi:hypothetical protein
MSNLNKTVRTKEQSMVAGAAARRRARSASAVAAGAVLLGLVGLLAAGVATGPAIGAAPVGEYPEVPTTDGDSGADATCALQAESLTPGETASVEVGGVDDGTVVRVYVGSELATEQAVDASNPVITFVVPDLPAGTSDVSVVGPTFTVACFSGVEVLGVQVANPAGGDSGPGGLAFTGIELALLVLIALVALVVGVLARRASQQRKRAAGVP